MFSKVVTSGLICGIATTGFSASLTAVGDLIRVPQLYGVSADGGMVGGTVSSANSFLQTEGFRWTPNAGFLSLGPFGPTQSRGNVNAISPDGGTLVGSLMTNNRQIAALWTFSGGWKTIGSLPTTGKTVATASSTNGAVVVGSLLGTGAQAFKYTPGTGVLGMGWLPGKQPATPYSYAYDVSSDGAVFVGESTYFLKTNIYPTGPYRWTSAAGMKALPPLTTKYTGGAAYAVSGNGVYTVGYLPNATNWHRAVRWNAWGNPEDLGVLPTNPASSAWSEAFEVNGDGSVVVGQASCGNVAVAFYWTAKSKMRGLIDVLRSQGVNVTGWSNLQVARSVSKDGLTIIGQGIYQGRSRAFVAKLDHT